VGAIVGRPVAVYPWIGCGTCAACRAGEENLCSAHHHLGIAADGGFATHVLIPHPRYLLDYAPLSPDFAGPLMCSGLTAYAALKRLASRAERGPVLLVGLGGVGMMGLALARALFRSRQSSPTSMPRSARRQSRPARRKPSIRPIRRRARRS
jgi:D-arabinose 1-dehydrogenase-like Zn-dependent alcohol dehydrogenase